MGSKISQCINQLKSIFETLASPSPLTTVFFIALIFNFIMVTYIVITRIHDDMTIKQEIINSSLLISALCIVLVEKKWKNMKLLLTLLDCGLLILMTLTVASMTAYFGLIFFRILDYKVTNYTMTPADSANYLLTSFVAVIIGYIYQGRDN